MKIIPFLFIASSDGQTVFGPIVPPVMPSAMPAINGVTQSPVSGDFSVSGGYYITIPNGVNKGDKVSGNLFL